MTPEFSRPVRIDTIGEGPRDVRIEASENERAALAQRFGLIALDALGAQATLTRDGDVVRVVGRLEARAVQPCVASGEPVPAHIDEGFTLRFAPPAEGAALDEVELAEDQLDELTYEHGAIDLGEAVAQTLALALDPFPRAADAGDRLREAGVVDAEDVGPFAALKALQRRV